MRKMEVENLFEATEKLQAILEELDNIKESYPGLYSEFLKLVSNDLPEFGPKLSKTSKLDSANGERVTNTQHVRAYLRKHPNSTITQVVDALEDKIDTSSDYPDRVIRSTLVNMEKKRNEIEKNDRGGYRLIQN